MKKTELGIECNALPPKERFGWYASFILIGGGHLYIHYLSFVNGISFEYLTGYITLVTLGLVTHYLKADKLEWPYLSHPFADYARVLFLCCLLPNMLMYGIGIWGISDESLLIAVEKNRLWLDILFSCPLFGIPPSFWTWSVNEMRIVLSLAILMYGSILCMISGVIGGALIVKKVLQAFQKAEFTFWLPITTLMLLSWAVYMSFDDTRYTKHLRVIKSDINSLKHPTKAMTDLLEVILSITSLILPLMMIAVVPIMAVSLYFAASGLSRKCK